MSPDLEQAEIDILGQQHSGGQGTPYEGSPLQRYHRRGPPALGAFEVQAPATRGELAALERERIRWLALAKIQARQMRAALVAFHASKRRTAKLKRTPPWAELEAMRAVYAEAQRLTAETGIPHHVDHDIPLQGELVSGLHVLANLQILTGSENSRKHNHFEP
jgi:hypothetical protein